MYIHTYVYMYIWFYVTQHLRRVICTVWFYGFTYICMVRVAYHKREILSSNLRSKAENVFSVLSI